MIKNFVGQIATLRLASGEEIIGTIGNCSDGFVEIDTPAEVYAGGMRPFFITSIPDRTGWFNIANIVAITETLPQAEKDYISKKSGIVVPEKKLLIS